MTIELTPDQIIAAVFVCVLVAIYIAGGIVLCRNPFPPEGEPDVPFTGFLLLVSPIWVPIGAAFWIGYGFFWALGRIVAAPTRKPPAS